MAELCYIYKLSTDERQDDKSIKIDVINLLSGTPFG